MKEQEIIDVVTAFQNGKKIQYRVNLSQWRHCTHPHWDFQTNEYRVAPEPKVIWVNEYNDKSLAGHNSKEQAIKNAAFGVIRIAVKYIEVIED